MADQREGSIGAESNAVLDDLVRKGDAYRGRALFALVDRAKAADEDAATRLAALSRLRITREDRLFHRVSLAWAAIIGLLETETPHGRGLAYEAYRALEPADREDLLSYLRVERIEDAHPRTS